MGASIDLVCWDFGDTLVDEMFMRLAPDGVPEWPAVYEALLAERPEWVEQWMMGDVVMNDLVGPLVDRLPMHAAQVSAHLRAVWSRIEWFDDSRAWIHRLDGQVAQVIVTVNPHEFFGIAQACGLDELIPVAVTSAELKTNSKVEMAERARAMLGLAAGLTTTMLIDNREDNIAEFHAAGGHAIHYLRDRNSLATLEDLGF